METLTFNRREVWVKINSNGISEISEQNMIKGYSSSQRGSHPRIGLTRWINVKNKTNSLREVKPSR
ncbi:MAG: hypothetical protein ACTS45_01030 [Candidatus Hodgkinia cicadicola]